MSSLPEQFQAARQVGIDHQLNFLRSLGDGLLDRTSRVFALNLDLSRATVEHASSAMRQLLAMRDPRDLLTIGAQSQRQLRTVFDYGQELMNIGAGLRGASLRTWSAGAATPALAAPVALAAAAEAAAKVTEATEASAEVVAEATAEASPAYAAAVADSDPVVTFGVVPPVEPTAIARATSEVLDLPLAPPHPVAASVPVDVDVEIELPKVEPVDATPPPAAPPHGAPKLTEIRGGRGRKKGS